MRRFPVILLFVTILLLSTSVFGQNKSACGDVNDDGQLNIADLAYMINWLYLSGPPPPDPSAADMDLCPGVDVGDVDYLLHSMFFGGPAPCVGPTDCTPYPGGEISLDYVDGELTPGVISIDHRISFFLRLTNNTPDVISALSGGFRVHSPDGAYWMSTEADTLMNSGFDLVMIETVYGTPGSGDDTVGVTAIALFEGMPPGFDDVVYKISVGPFSAADIGKTICLDTAFFGNGGTWKWSVGGQGHFVPAWAGPQCFTIAEPSATGITLAEVTGGIGSDSIRTNVPVTFHLNYSNNSGHSILGWTNGYRIYSPDAAEWGSTVGDTTGAVDGTMFDLVHAINHFGVTGNGADTVGFGGAIQLGPGVPDGFNDVPYTITIGPIDAAYDGHTICLDSSWFPPSGVWKWSTGAFGEEFPTWSGPYCFTVANVDPQPQPAAITLDHVNGLNAYDSLWSEAPIAFHLRVTNNTGESVNGFTNGFRLYSPDGATWQPAVGDTVSHGWWDRFDLIFSINHFSCNGWGADTVSFGGARLDGPGLETGFDAVSFIVHTQVSGDMLGKTLCLDSSYFPPSNVWLWSLTNVGAVVPQWDGPHCFPIGGAMPGVGDSLIVPSVTVNPGNMVQPVHVKLTQSIKGASIPLKIPEGVEIDSLSRVGLITESWDYTFSYIKPDSGFLLMVLANSAGATIPTGEHAVFDIYFRALNAECDVPSLIHWDTALSNDPIRGLLFADNNSQDLQAAFDRDRDVSEVPPYLPGDQDGNAVIDIADLVFMVDYMFNGGPPPAIMNVIDVNGSCTGPNIADLVYFVDYMFVDGPPPLCGCLGAGGAKVSINDAITMGAVYENGITTIILKSPQVLRGLEVELVGEAQGEPVNLMADRLDLVYGFVDDRLRIGLLDLDGGETIGVGDRKVVEIPGKWEIASALVAADGRRAQSVRVNNAIKSATIPSTYALHQNYPNPFNPQTQIDFSLPVAGFVKLEVYNVMGQKVAVLVDGQLEAGVHSATFDGRSTASGVYFYRLSTDGFTHTRKMILLK